MNEIKRQLNKKLGDTAPQTNAVIQKIEQEKRKKRMVTTKKRSTAPYFVGFATVVTALLLFFLIGPSFKDNVSQSNPTENPPAVTTPTDEPTPEVTPNESEAKARLRDYFFKKDGDVAYFHGVGNEYATFKETTTWLSDDYIAVITDGGAGDSLVVYHILDNAIEVVYEKILDVGEQLPRLEEVSSLQPIRRFIEAPFENTKFGEQTIIKNVPFTTPYGKLTTLVLETKFDENTSSKEYYAEGLGLVGRVYEDNSEEPFAVASYLNTINEEPKPDYTQMVEVYNETTKETEKYSLEHFTVIDPYLFKMNPENYNLTYNKLVDLKNHELGIFTFECNKEEQCTHLFVMKNAEEFNPLHIVGGSYGLLSYSPDGKKLVVPIYSLMRYDNATVDRGSLFAFDLETETRIEPKEMHDYFEAPYYPLLSYKWINNSTIEIEVADVSDYSSEALVEWTKTNNKPSKKVQITLP